MRLVLAAAFLSISFFPFTHNIVNANDCVVPTPPSFLGPPIAGQVMPSIAGKTVTREDRERFDREHPDVSHGPVPSRKDVMSLEEKKAALQRFEAERQKHPDGRPSTLFPPPASLVEQTRAYELARQVPCPPQAR